MPTLLLRIVAPLQSWGIKDPFELRSTELEPSKSGILGMICAALGRDRQQDISDLRALKMGVRVDKTGHLECDFHTALNVARASGSGNETQTSKRYYLADAQFVVGLEGEEAILNSIKSALASPHWPIFYGRKSCVPSLPPLYSSQELRQNPQPKGLLESLRNAPPANPKTGDASKNARVQVECDMKENGAMERFDVPASFDYGKRDYLPRYVQDIDYNDAAEKNNVL